MPKIFYIHGGHTHSSPDNFLDYLRSKEVDLEPRTQIWTDLLEANLPNHQIIRPKLPNKDNADYHAWEIIFKKYIQYIEPSTILLGFSLGATFLMKFLSHNKLPVPPAQIILVAGPIDSEGSPEELCNGFATTTTELDSQTMQEQSRNIHLFYATDDPIVPISQMQKIQPHLPKANFTALQNKGGHFITPGFPELINHINNAK